VKYVYKVVDRGIHDILCQNGIQNNVDQCAASFGFEP
jgi:hypothetical protein